MKAGTKEVHIREKIIIALRKQDKSKQYMATLIIHAICIITCGLNLNNGMSCDLSVRESVRINGEMDTTDTERQSGEKETIL